MPNSQGLPIIAIVGLIRHISYADTYFFNISFPICHDHIGLSVKIFKALLPSPILATC